MLENKTALVTGGGRGLGRGICLELARQGADVAVLDLREAEAKAVAGEVRALGRRSVAHSADVTRSDQVRAAVERTIAELGRVDILVNNAGWDKMEPFLQSTEETWDRVLAINLKGQIICARAVLDGMVAQGGGRIINIASDAGRVGSTGEAVYSAAKGGVIAFTKTLARELARYSITANCLCPGPSDTPLFAELSADNPRLTEALARAIPLRRLGTPEDLAPAVAFFASDAAGYITGQTLSVSGGLTMS
jgi:2-hydroxycyclohexanecarboxyl-CoA dehydrogenase